MMRTLAALALPALAAPSASDAVDDYVAGVMTRDKIPGVAVLVMRNGEIERARGYGFANLEHQVPVTDETVFQSGSIGKMFTAAGILLLADEGRLSLDDRLARFFPDGPSSWHRITIRNLLTHTSGIEDYGDEFDYRKSYTDDEMLAVMKELPLDFEPGTQWSYSNSGYLILGLLTTKIAGVHWGTFQAEHLFGPLGMASARMISERDLVPHRAAGYELDAEREVKNQEWVSQTFNSSADGALYFSLRDLAAWERALEAHEFLSEESFSAWWSPVVLASGARYPYGFGWGLVEQRGERRIEHSGAWQGFRSAIARYPDQGLMVAVLANLDAATPWTMAHVIAGLVEPALRLRDLDERPPDPDEARTARLRGVLEAWARFRPDPAMAAGLAATASGSRREAGARNETGKRLAAATSFLYVGEDELSPAARQLNANGAVRGVDCALETPEARHAYRFLLDADGRVLGFGSETR